MLCDSVEQCCRALMGHPIEKIIHEELARRPCQNAVDTIQKTMAIHCQYWNNLSSYADRVGLSHFESWGKEKEDTEALSAMASLSMQHSVKVRPQWKKNIKLLSSVWKIWRIQKEPRILGYIAFNTF